MPYPGLTEQEAERVPALTPAKFRTRRESQGLTQKAVGACLGVAANTVARWERGEIPIPRWVALLFAQREHVAASLGDSPLMAALLKLRKEITRRRKANNDKRLRSNWNPESIIKLELVRLLDWIEDELEALTLTIRNV